MTPNTAEILAQADALKTKAYELIELARTMTTEAQAKSPDWRFLSACPDGYDTILGYLAKNHPSLIERMEEDAEATQRDGFWMQHRCRERGIERVWVAAPLVLQNQGIHKVFSYPVELLQERFGE